MGWDQSLFSWIRFGERGLALLLEGVELCSDNPNSKPFVWFDKEDEEFLKAGFPKQYYMLLFAIFFSFLIGKRKYIDQKRTKGDCKVYWRYTKGKPTGNKQVNKKTYPTPLTQNSYTHLLPNQDKKSIKKCVINTKQIIPRP